MIDSYYRVDDILAEMPDSRINKIAVIHNDKKYSYIKMYDGMLDIAAALKHHKIQNERVIVLLGNRPEAIMAIFGISYSGNTFVPVGDNIKPTRLNDIINDSGATAIITDNKHLNIVNALPENTKLSVVIDGDDLNPYIGIRHAKQAYPASLMYTSGTTGTPKGVVCSHRNILNAVDSINAYLYHTSLDVISTALPLSHGYGLYQIFTAFSAGATVLLENDFRFPIKNLENIKKYSATGFATVPSMVQLMMAQVDDWSDYLNNLDYITTAGAALTPADFSTLVNNLPVTSIIPMYGQTECVRAFYYPTKYQKLYGAYDSCGICIPGTETRLIDVDDLGCGELLVKSNHVMCGYWNKPEETQKTFINGWLHTGDIFRKGDNGLHYYVGRKDDVVKIKGERCAPQELDNALMKITGVCESASFAIPDNIWGYRFVVYVATQNKDLTKNDVMRFCKQNLEPHFLPKDVIIVNTIPKTDNGKISRKVLKDMYGWSKK